MVAEVLEEKIKSGMSIGLYTSIILVLIIKRKNERRGEDIVWG